MKNSCLFIGLLSLLFSCSSSDKTAERISTVKVDTVKIYGQEQEMLVPGKVKPSEDVSLSFRVAGQLARVLVKDGTHVRKGQLLAELDDTDYKIQLSATEAEYSQIKAEAERVMAMYKDGSTTANNNDKAVYGLKQITAKLENHRNQVAYTKLYAPFDGVVQQRLFEENETVGAGMPVLTLIGSGSPEVEINISASAYMLRDKMDSFSCTFDVFPGQTFPLSFISIKENANANQLYQARLKLSRVDGKQPAVGMSTMVRILVHMEGNETMSVPVSSLLEENGKTYVLIVNAGVVKKVEVTALAISSDGRSIVSGNIRQGDLVIRAGIHHVKDGEKVKCVDPVSKSNVGGLL